MANIVLAQKINRLLGTHIGCWEVDDLDEITLDYIRGLSEGVTDIRQAVVKVETIKERLRGEFRKRNQGYVH